MLNEMNVVVEVIEHRHYVRTASAISRQHYRCHNIQPLIREEPK